MFIKGYSEVLLGMAAMGRRRA